MQAATIPRGSGTAWRMYSDETVSLSPTTPPLQRIWDVSVNVRFPAATPSHVFDSSFQVTALFVAGRPRASYTAAIRWGRGVWGAGVSAPEDGKADVTGPRDRDVGVAGRREQNVAHLRERPHPAALPRSGRGVRPFPPWQSCRPLSCN